MELRKRFPEDARILFGIVKAIIPLPDNETADGTCGEWIPGYFNSLEDQIGYFNRFGDHGQGYGTLKLLDHDLLTADIIVHEFGHAFSTLEDQLDRGGPLAEWDCEAAADMHAVRWGLMDIQEIQRRHKGNVDAVMGEEFTCGAGWAHHGPVPGGDWMEFNGQRWRLTKDFVFEHIDNSDPP